MREWLGRQFTGAEREKNHRAATVLFAALLFTVFTYFLRWFFTAVVS